MWEKILGENSVYIEKESGRKFRDLLGPPKEGNMLGGRRFKARQPSELVFLRTSELVYIHKQIATKKSNQVNGFLKEIFWTKQIITRHRLMHETLR